MTKALVTKIIFGILLFVGLSRIIGHVFNFENLIRLGNSFAASPAPRPFSIESHAQKFELIWFLSYKDNLGKISHIEFSQAQRRKILGPHRRKIPYMVHFYRGSLNNPQRYHYLLAKAFCPNGSLQKELNIPILNQFSFIHGELYSPRKFIFEVNCP